MSNFEENFTRWIDGAMSPDEEKQFLTQLTAKQKSEAAEWQAIREAWKLEAEEHAVLPQGDFFNHQLRERILQQSTTPTVPAAPPFPRRLLAWAFTALFLAAVVTLWNRDRIFTGSDAMVASDVLKTQAYAPNLYAYSFKAPNHRGAVIWVNGADYIPPDQKIP